MQLLKLTGTLTHWRRHKMVAIVQKTFFYVYVTYMRHTASMSYRICCRIKHGVYGRMLKCAICIFHRFSSTSIPSTCIYLAAAAHKTCKWSLCHISRIDCWLKHSYRFKNCWASHLETYILWRHQMKTVTRSFDVFFDLSRNNGWVNIHKAGDLRRSRAHYDNIVMKRHSYTFKTWSIMRRLLRYWITEIKRAISMYRLRSHEQNNMGQVTELWLSCYLVLLSIDSKTR